MATIVSFDERANTPAGKKALDILATHVASEGAGLVKALRPSLAAFAESDALRLLTKVNELAMAKRPGFVPAEVTGPRVSEAAGLFKCAEFAAWPAFADQLETINPAWSDLVRCSNWFRKEYKKRKTDPTPPTEEATRGMLKTAADKRAANKARMAALAKAREGMNDTDKVRAKPTKTLDDAVAGIRCLAEIEGKGKGAAFLTAALKALTDYRPLVAAREREAVQAKAAADALAKFDAEQAAGK